MLLLFSGGIGHHGAAVGLHTGGEGGDIGVILKGGMDHMALIGVHGLQSAAAACIQHLRGLLTGIAEQALIQLEAE